MLDKDKICVAMHMPVGNKSDNLTKYERDFAPYLKSNFCGL